MVHMQPALRLIRNGSCELKEARGSCVKFAPIYKSRRRQQPERS